MESLRHDGLTVPLRRRFAVGHRGFDEAMAAHDAAVRADRPVYRDPTTGLSVFTARFLAERGYCCVSGCRHCPFLDQ